MAVGMSARNRTLKIADIKVSCGSCSLSELCLPHGMDGDDMQALDDIVYWVLPCRVSWWGWMA